MKLQRLQGLEFHNKKSTLNLVAYSISDAGNICGYYCTATSIYPKFYHWMNDVEKSDFLNHPIEVVKVPNHRSASKWRVNNEEETAV